MRFKVGSRTLRASPFFAGSHPSGTVSARRKIPRELTTGLDASDLDFLVGREEEEASSITKGTNRGGEGSQAAASKDRKGQGMPGSVRTKGFQRILGNFPLDTEDGVLGFGSRRCHF